MRATLKAVRASSVSAAASATVGRKKPKKADAGRDLEVFDDGPGLADSDSVVEQEFGQALEQA
ncbi:hypothetical protein [Glutamicibacter protophormiae]|uniref:hypothetical protein n=1 Tax=Glutamicibacter protophormiae TaxID=37930 RepID=UPI0033254D54